ncbi:hypothetical protein [Natrinema halophilum]|uniref:Glycosyl hydrolase n=1 Tax=Natrinema halophilum TaxID=1699371 RepID=A0A7D5H729_9EURY|nr:hypothetical protein [Natrinema halophilum]QLG49035.1 hypothetical protein HYG82_09335 [Natrinema halophilum]
MMTVIVVLRDRLLVCTGESEPGEWTTTTRLEGFDLECAAIQPDAPEQVFAGTVEDGLFRSRGDRFERLEAEFGPADLAASRPDGKSANEAGPESGTVMAVTISPHDPQVVYVGTEPSRIYRSRDGGDSWSHLEGLVDLPSADEWYFPPRPDTHHVRWLEVDPFDPERLYVGIEAGAFVYTRDGGETWHERPDGARRDVHSMAMHADQEGRVYTAAGDGYAESDDSARSWRRPQDGLEHRYCWSVVPDPGDPDRVLISSARGARTAHTASRADSHVYRKNGDSWVRLDDRGLPTGEGVVRTVFATTGEPGVVFAVNNRGLFATRDFGDSWSRQDIDWGGEFEGRTPRGLVAG